MISSDEQLLKKIKELKDQLTFDYHKKEFDEMEKALRTAVIRKKIYDMQPIQDFVKNLKKKINACEELLKTDRESTDEERKLIFYQEDIWQYIVSFFERPQKTMGSIKKRVGEETKR